MQGSAARVETAGKGKTVEGFTLCTEEYGQHMCRLRNAVDVDGGLESG